MKRIFKIICPLLIISIIFSSCNLDSSKKTIEQINTYISENDFNSCLQYVKELDSDEKNRINNDVCNTVINKFLELKNKTKIDETNIFDLSLIDTVFAENSQKLWNIISEFSIDKNADNYNEIINLRYYSEMLDYTRYCDIYALIKKVSNSGYIDNLSVALYEYDKNGNNSNLKLLADDVKNMNFNSFDPQQYLVSDFRNAHNDIVKAMSELEDGFSSNDSTTVATAIHTLNNALTEILYITDTLTAINSIQQIIYNKISTENIYAPFDNEISVTKRDFSAGMSFSLDLIFGGIDDIGVDDNTETTTNSDNINEIAKEEAIKIAVNAINKTKAFTGNVNITLTQTRNIQLTAFESNSTITDAENMIKAQLNQVIDQSNGTGKKTEQFSNGTNGNQTLNSFVPPSDKTATLNDKTVKEYTCIKGSGGYIITLTLERELVKSGKSSNGIGTFVNTFEFDNNENVKDSDTSYSETYVTIIVNNSGTLIEMEYTIDGISNCTFTENNNQNEYKAQFAFRNNYKYEFEY